MLMEEENALKYCLQFAQRAYDQEMERQRYAASKADYLLKYLTLLMTAFNITVSVVSKMSNVRIAGIIFWGLYIPMLVAGVVGIVSTLMIQKPRKIRVFPLGKEELLKVQNDSLQYDTDCKRIYQEILLTDKITVSLRENNNTAMIWIMSAYISLAVMTIIFGVFITYVIRLT